MLCGGPSSTKPATAETQAIADQVRAPRPVPRLTPDPRGSARLQRLHGPRGGVGGLGRGQAREGIAGLRALFGPPGMGSLARIAAGR